MADPLVSITPGTLSPADGNYALWITVKTPAGTPAGTYEGRLTFQDNSSSSISVPLALTVYDFELPEYSTFQSNVGGQYFSNPEFADGKKIIDYHGLKTKEELKKLVRKYYDVMALNKFYPKTVVLYSEIGMSWTRPPEGYNVDKSGNYFKFHDWDFTEFNRDLKHYIDDLKVNSVTLTHTNPTTCNRFKHLPGPELKNYEKYPPHKTMAWQLFTKTTMVGYDVGNECYFNDKIVEITKDQYDHLLIDFYRAMAKNLEKNGWLDYFYRHFAMLRKKNMHIVDEILTA